MKANMSNFFAFLIYIALMMIAMSPSRAREIPAPQSSLASMTGSHHPSPPNWPKSYTIEYIFTIPYLKEIQPDAIRYTVKLYREEDESSPCSKTRKVRLETLGGANTMIAIDGDAEYELVPQINKQKCIVFKGGAAASANALPDISDWQYAGQKEYKGQLVNVWEYKKTNTKAASFPHYSSSSSPLMTEYQIYVSLKGDPLFMHMKGPDITVGSHYGEYTIEYQELIAEKPDPSLFDPPSLCDEREMATQVGTESTSGSHSMSPAAHRMFHLVPMIKYGSENDAYDDFLSSHHGHRRIHHSLEEYRFRKGIFQKNLDSIQRHNSNTTRSYTMSINQFADWTREEFSAMMLSNHGAKNKNHFQRRKGDDLERNQFPYEPVVNPRTIPAAVDWRGSGADTGVKDQALCGSCWTFGAVGAMESAWFRATGRSDRFSEQQVMDCTWGYEPDNSLCSRGCDGGSAWAGIGHIVEAGGISLLKDYQYLGITDYCKEKSRRKKGKFKGYARIPSGDDRALMEAIYSRGPVAVSLDASRDSFSFYSGGIYEEPDCRYEYDDLDHAMVAVGYGTENGRDYWIIKNSWAPFWGENGYMRVARDVQRGCGASTDALYAIVDEEMARSESI